ncbi:MAG: hypothetical protein A3K18_30405 [Lentisphaerae bacterium RIFOXYA12_64_32]|nr:MAG: hypothetical protein A3K18_30405 [Lentisphaerae bacterium RIFOXYA12_64_32]
MKNQQDRYEPVGGHKEMVARWKRDPAFRQAYDDLADEISLFDTCLAARKRAGLSQSEVARRMGTSRPVVARIESPTLRHYPSLRTLHRYAKAVGCNLRINLV